MSFMSLKINPSSLRHKKRFFKVKEGRKDGQILQIQCPKPKYGCYCGQPQLRFTNVAFSKTGQILIMATSKGDVYNFNFTQCRFWHLTNTNSCIFLTFNSINDKEIFIGKNNGTINIIDVESGELLNTLNGHKHPVKSISFAKDNFLGISSSQSEAIIWDLRSCTKLETLNISKSSGLKLVMFVPISDNVLICFNDDTIHIWKYGTFDHIKQIKPALWNKFIIKCLAFTRNGRIVVLAGYSHNLAVFKTDTWTLEKNIVLPPQIRAIKRLDFISNPFDGGSNRVLSILTLNGLIYFYDMLRDIILTQLSFNIEIIRYNSSYDGRFIACITSDGKAYMYLLANYVATDEDCQKKVVNVVQKNSNVKRSLSALYSAKEKIEDVLDVGKLVPILKEYGQYPEMHRFKIWTQILQLPCNVKQYQILNNKFSEIRLNNDLEKKYPIENPILMKNLKKLLIALNLWCPFFSEVTYLPLFVFPFVKMFQNDPLICFEAVITLLMNWCQYWFEYYPLPPVNVLAMVENVLLHHDPTLIQHLIYYNVTSKTYAWSLMQTCFSEVLCSNDWLILWDHILSNEPSFLIMVTVAYSLTQKQRLMQLIELQDFHSIYYKQNCVDIKKLISKSYQLLESTENIFHPRRYLNNFTKLDDNVYPIFNAYPKAVLDYQANINEMKRLKEDKKILDTTNLEYNKLQETKRHIEEYIRLKEVDHFYRKKLEQERANFEKESSRDSKLKEFLGETRDEIIIPNKYGDEKTDLLNPKLFQYLNFYQKIIKTDCAVKAFSLEDSHKVSLPDNYRYKIEKTVNEAYSKAQTVANSEQYLAQLTITTGLGVVDSIMTEVKQKIKECSRENKNVNKKFVDFMMGQIECTERHVEAVLNDLTKNDEENKYQLYDLKDKSPRFRRKKQFKGSTGTV
nr:TBC1 domain family member 31 [Onthophagus taurus]